MSKITKNYNAVDNQPISNICLMRNGQMRDI